MSLETKRHRGRVEIKDAAQGLVSAVFATTEMIDKDGDYTLDGAFTAGERVLVSEWNHSAVTGPHPPIGDGVVRVSGREAIVDAKLFVGTPRGAAMAETLRALGGLIEWSYAFDVLDSDTAHMDGRAVRVLKRLRVFEASPVWQGAGVDTRTLSAKDSEILRAAQRHVNDHEAHRFLQGAHIRLIHSGLCEGSIGA